MTIVKTQGSLRASGIEDVELSAVLQDDMRDDFLGPLFVESFVVSRDIKSMLTNTLRHVTYCTFKIL